MKKASEKSLYNSEFLEKWHGNYSKLETLLYQNTSASQVDSELQGWVQRIRPMNYRFDLSLKFWG